MFLLLFTKNKLTGKAAGRNGTKACVTALIPEKTTVYSQLEASLANWTECTL